MAHTDDPEGVGKRPRSPTTRPGQGDGLQQLQAKVAPQSGVSDLKTAMSSPSNCLISAGGLRYFTRAWRNYTSDPDMLDIVKHCHIEFVSEPQQHKLPQQISFSRKEIEWVHAKTMIKKVQRDHKDPYSALLELRNTPIQGLNYSPAQMMLGRRTRTLVPTRSDQLKPSCAQVPLSAIQKKNAVMKKWYDKSAKPLMPLQMGDTVRVDRFDSTRRRAKWEKRTVTTICDTAPRSYIIRGSDGTTYRRNRIHIRPSPSNSEPFNIDDLDEATEAGELGELEMPAPIQEQPAGRRSVRTRRAPVYRNDFITT